MNTLHKMMKAFNVALGGAFVAFGLSIVMDAFNLAYLEAKFRIMFGVIFMLYGLLRVATALAKNSAGQNV